MHPINIDNYFKKLSKPWHPKEIARINDDVVRVAIFHGEYHWHKHNQHDEMFHVIKGEIAIKLRDQNDLELGAGELVVIPRGVEHKPIAKSPARVLLFEPRNLVAPGD